jgi:CubicO group peptidase (beta-lactamase class C family)
MREAALLYSNRRTFILQSGVALAGALSVAAFPKPQSDNDSAHFKSDVPTGKIIEYLEQAIPQMIEEYTVPGLSAALIKDAKVVWRKGYGVRSNETREPVNTETIFEAASLSKPVFAYAALKLCEKGLLDLDKPLTDYLSQPYITDEPRIKQVTARHVLTHTTGFPNWRTGANLKFIYNPGERFSYSGEGFVYLQYIVEKITAKPLHEYLQQEIFAPFGMPNSSFIWLDKFASSTAAGHDAQGKVGYKGKPDKANAAASLHTTAGDYAKFVAEVIKPSKKDPFHLGETMTSAMLKAQVKVNDSLGWGLGWGVQMAKSGESFFHWGNNNNRFKNFVVFSRNQKIGLTVFTNSGNGLKLCKKLVPLAIGGDHPAFSWSMVG